MSLKQEIETLTHVNYEKWSFIVTHWAKTEGINLEDPGEKDGKLAFFLATAVADEVIPSIINLQTGKEMWARLKSTNGVSAQRIKLMIYGLVCSQ